MCFAGLALQMLEWRDVIELAVQTLGTDPQGLVVLLELLTVLPEEVTEGRKVSLSVSVYLFLLLLFSFFFLFFFFFLSSPLPSY